MTSKLIWTSEAIVNALSGKSSGASGWQATGVSIDSRTVQKGDLFIALKGPVHDGHDHVAEALKAGAVAAIVALNSLSRIAGEGGAHSRASAREWEGEGVVANKPSPVFPSLATASDRKAPSPAMREREIPAPHLWSDDKAEKEAAKLLPAARPLLALAPAANWPCKQWPIERFAELAKKLTAADGSLTGASVVVIADAHEREQIRPLLQSIPSDRLVEIIGRDLLTVAACLKQCRLFVGNDSGLMHVAAAMGTPTLGLFGPGYEEIYGPWGPHCAVIRTSEPREELLARLPDLSAREPNLMGGLSVERVYEAAVELLEKTVPPTIQAIEKQ
jgi:ADP-heptose:LPS heptosyltransferase